MTVEDNALVFGIVSDGVYKERVFFMGKNVSASFSQDDWLEGDKTFEFKTVQGGEVVSIRRV